LFHGLYQGEGAVSQTNELSGGGNNWAIPSEESR